MDKSQKESPEKKHHGHQKMAIIGMGTEANPLDPLALKSAVPEAIRLGCGHFDITRLYRSERDLDLVSSREELFVASELWCFDAHSDLTASSLQETLINLQLEYLDLHLIHWPISAKPGKFQHPIPEEDLVLTMDFKSARERIKENLDIFYRALSAEDHEKICRIQQP